DRLVRPSFVPSRRAVPARPKRTLVLARRTHMAFQSRARWLRLAVLTVGLLALAPASARLVAQTQTRQVSVESLIYDLKSPDPLRRQAAARDLGAAKHRAATPDLVAM